MRILHFADVHIGVENYSKVDPETGLSSRLGDFLQTFDQMVDDAIESKVDLALFCGDAYKSRDPSQTHQREFAKRIVRLSNAGIPTFLLVGNHDTPNSPGRATSLDIYQTLDVPKVTIGDTPKMYTVETASGPIQIVAVPWVRRSQLLAQEDSRRLTPDQINEDIQARLTRIIQDNVNSLDPAVPAVLAGHVTVGQSTVSSEQSMTLGRDYVLVKSSVTLPQLDYVALGHIHKHQILDTFPRVVYAGSLQRIDFGEENDDKGYCVIDLEPLAPQGNRVTKFEFRQVEARRFLTIDVKIDASDEDPTATVISAIQRVYVDDAIVRLRISLPVTQEAHLSDGDIQDALSAAHFVASISHEITERPRTRLAGAYDRGLSPQQALKRYLDSRQTAPDRAAALQQRAEELIADQSAE
jgi:exonuclease SbcD